MKAAALTRLPVLIFCFTLLGNAQSPIEIPWSERYYGPDGPWHAIRVQIGTPPQPVDLFPGSPGAPNILSASYCLNNNLTDCTGSFNYFSPNASQSYDDTWSQSAVGSRNVTGDPTWELPLYSSGEWGLATDTFSIPVRNGTALSSNGSMQVLNDGQVSVGSDGFSTHYRLGTLGLGSTTTGIVPHGESGPYIGNISVNYAYQNASRTPSASFALQCGSVLANVTPSLHFGGYDRSRVVGKAISSIFRGNDAIVGLKDISIGSFWGPSPFNLSGDVQSGLLQTNISNGEPSNTTLDAFISPEQPFMVLPPETCTAIIGHLPVTYDSPSGLYVWDESSSLYREIVSGPHYLSFTFTDPGSTSARASSASDIEIKVPFALLKLTLEPTIQQPNMPPRAYFPCYRYDRKDWVQWKLGRAFLQAAYLVGNWIPHAPNAHDPVAGGWSLAQAPGPHAKPADVQALRDWDYSITPGYDADELAATWGFVRPSASSAGPPPAQAASTSAGGTSLSAGAKAGIAIAVVLAAVLVACAALVLFRRRRQQQQQWRVQARASDGAVPYAAEKMGSEVYDAALLDSRTVVPEMPVRRDEALELPGSGPVVPPKDGVWARK